jgi:hypothetical protein
LDHYLHSAYEADRLLFPARDPIEVPLMPPAEGSRPEGFTGSPAAMTWFGTEHPVLLAVARLAAGTGQDARAWQLAWVVDTFLYRRGHWHDRVAYHSGKAAKVAPAATSSQTWWPQVAFLAGAHPGGLQPGHQAGHPDRDRHEDEVVNGGDAELPAGDVERVHGVPFQRLPRFC